MNAQGTPAMPLFKRLAGGLFFCLIGILFCMVTLVDVTLFRLTRRCKTGLGPRPRCFSRLGRILFAPTRRAFWAVGFWAAILTLLGMLLRL